MNVKHTPYMYPTKRNSVTILILVIIVIQFWCKTDQLGIGMNEDKSPLSKVLLLIQNWHDILMTPSTKNCLILKQLTNKYRKLKKKQEKKKNPRKDKTSQNKES